MRIVGGHSTVFRVLLTQAVVMLMVLQSRSTWC